MVFIDFQMSVIYDVVSSKIKDKNLKINHQMFLRLFIFGPWIEYSIDRQLTKHTHGSATVAISARMGVLLRLKYNFCF